MSNLLEETTKEIERSGHSPSDIVFIGSRTSGYRCTWDEYVALADVEYDSGYGAQRVASDLEVHFVDGSWLERSEYDGAEGWDFRAPLVIAPVKAKRIERLTVEGTDRVGWVDLAELNEHPNYDD